VPAGKPVPVPITGTVACDLSSTVETSPAHDVGLPLPAVTANALSESR